MTRILPQVDVDLVGGLVVVIVCALGFTSTAHAQSQDERIQALIAALKHPNKNMRETAARALEQIGPEAVAAVPALVAALSDPEREVQDAATDALAEIGPGALPALTEALSDPKPETRKLALMAIWSMGPAASAAAPALEIALKDPVKEIRRSAAGALWTLGAAAAPAIPGLLDALHDPDPEVRESVVYALTGIGQALKEEGKTLWWAVILAYWRELALLLASLVAWFLCAGRFPRRRPHSKTKQVILLLLTASIPLTLSSCAVYMATSREWAEFFLPDVVLTVVPFPWAASLSAGFVCVVIAVWVCQRKPLAADTDSGGTSPRDPVEPAPGYA